jgi:RNA methyltransferase, TrmH family
MLSKTHTKYIQSLWHKKQRDETGLFIAEGPKLVADLLSTKVFACKEILALESWLQQQGSILASLKGTTIHAVQDFELEKISKLTTANSVVAVFEKRKEDHQFKPTGKITLALDTIQDPGNLGTIIRIADWFGIENIVCSIGCADMYNPKVVQSTMGSLGRVNVIYTNLAFWLEENKQVMTYAASLAGKHIKAIGKLKEGVIIIGNEAHGISEDVISMVNEKITIPKIGEAESLNAAVATGIILSHFRS